MEGSQRSTDDAQAWAKLSSFTLKLGNLNLTKDSYQIGRNLTNDVAIPDKRLSKVHCKVFKDADDNCWIEDLSANGIFIENEIIGKGNKQKLNSGDKIYLLHPSKVKPRDVLGYIFSTNIEEVYPIEVSPKDLLGCILFIEDKFKRQREEDIKELVDEKNETEKQMKLQEDSSEQMICPLCLDYIYQCVTLIPCLHNFCGACISDWMQWHHECFKCKEEFSEIKRNLIVNNMIQEFVENNPTKKRPKEKYEKMDQKNKITEDRLIIKNLK